MLSIGIWKYYYNIPFPSELTIEFDSPDYTVIEDSGTVTVCLITNRGTATALMVDVVASVKSSSSNPACKCLHVHSVPTEKLYCPYSWNKGLSFMPTTLPISIYMDSMTTLIHLL